MRPLRLIVTAGAGALLGSGCGLHPGEAWNRSDGEVTGGAFAAGPVSSSSGDDATDQSLQGLCPATSSRLTGVRAAGDPCSVPGDCASTCCDCGTGSQSWLAASCVAGRCVDSVTSCSRTRARYCGAGVILGPVPTGGQCGSATASTVCEACIDASCCAESLACSENTSCVALETCDASCVGDPDCRVHCYATSAGGALTLQALDSCVASACGAACQP